MQIKKFLILAVATASLSSCGSPELLMSMDSMRLIQSTGDPKQVMDFANQNCRSDFYRGASFISKSGDEYRFRCIRDYEQGEPALIPESK